jgi:hypothetical protein
MKDGRAIKSLFVNLGSRSRSAGINQFIGTIGRKTQSLVATSGKAQFRATEKRIPKGSGQGKGITAAIFFLSTVSSPPSPPPQKKEHDGNSGFFRDTGITPPGARRWNGSAISFSVIGLLPIVSTIRKSGLFS